MSRQGLWVGMNVADRYSLTGDIGGGGLGRVHSAIAFSDPSQPVAVRIIERKRLHASDVLRFQALAAAVRRLRHPNILSFHEFGLYQPQKSDGSVLAKGYMVVSEMPKGKSLRDWLQKDDLRRLDLGFDLALQLSAALDYAHGRGILHRDIRPLHILVDDSTGDYQRLYRLRDFGLAALNENAELQGQTEALAAGAPYLAPECSGLLETSMDQRSDLYALGCVLYEVLCGRPPFIAEDVFKLAKKHAFTAPEPIRSLNPDVPDWFEALVLKLLAKNPSDRYQSAFGLHCDLQRILRLSQDQTPWDRSDLGRSDRLPLQTAQLPLLGREDELKRLIASLRAHTGKASAEGSHTRLMLLRGVRGSGKTRLMQEFRSYLSKQRIPVISCSFSRTENSLPLNALANAFNDYLGSVHRSESSEIEAIKLRIASHLGASAPVIASVIQGLKPYLEIETDESLDADMNLAASYEIEDFGKILVDFTRCLANDNETVAFLFDDVHFADAKSLSLIHQFLAKSHTHRFLVVASFRSACHSSQIKYQEFVSRFSALDRRLQTIDVDPLKESQVQMLSQNLMAHSESEKEALHRFLYAKTRGNPLRLSETVRLLLIHGVLTMGCNGRWVFHPDTTTKIDGERASIDLLLLRLNELDPADKRILEMAAVIGLLFGTASLDRFNDIDRLRARRVIDRALQIGWLKPGPDFEREEGQFCQFSDRCIREALLDGLPSDIRGLWHRDIALQLEQRGERDQPAAIFSLAHHFFLAARLNPGAASALIEKCLKSSINAGRKALEMGSELTAQRYFENGTSMLSTVDAKAAENYRRTILNALADIHFSRRDYNDALRLYQELLKMPMDGKDYSLAAYKFAHLILISGNITASLYEISKGFQGIGWKVVRLDRYNFFGVVRQFALSVLLPLRRTGLMKALEKAHPNRQTTFSPESIYLLGQYASFNFDKRLALIYHTRLLKAGTQRSLPLDLMLRLVCDHATILSYLGFQKRAYACLDLAFEFAKKHNQKAAVEYALYQKNLLIDQYQGKLEAPRINSDVPFASLQTQEYLLHGMQERIFHIQNLLVRGRGKALHLLFQSLPTILPARHWLTTKAVSMYLFWLMLADRRELIISYGSFVGRRSIQKRGDAFSRTIEAIVALAAGERDNALAAYEGVLGALRDTIDTPWILPYEMDFLLLFVGNFPEAFASEYGEDLVRSERFRPLLKRLLPLVQHRRHRRRAVPELIKARLFEIFGRRNVKVSYDRALKRARLSEQPLVEMICRVWFARHLTLVGSSPQDDYFEKAYAAAKGMKLELICSMISQLLRSKGRTLLLEGLMAELKPQIDPILLKHLALTPQLKTYKLTLDQAREQLEILLKQRFTFDRFYLYTIRDIAAFKAEQRLPGTKEEEVLLYTAPYVKLKTTLKIPIFDAPWKQDVVSRSERGHGPEPLPILVFGDSPQAIDKTNYLRARIEAGIPLPVDAVIDEHFGPVNTLVPIRYEDQGLGVIFLEGSRVKNEETHALRKTLDSFGAQIGIWLRPYLLAESKSPHLPVFSFRAGEYQLEPCPWLQIWTEGQLRSTRESVWYLGLNLGPDTYLLAHCRISGPDELRDALSAMIWYEFLVTRTLTGPSGPLTPEDVEQGIIRHLLAFQNTVQFDDIAISFSILRQETGEVWSGHFGPVRPVLLGSSNQITPHNKPILSLSDERKLRFWKVTADQFEKGLLVLPQSSVAFDSFECQSFDTASTIGTDADGKAKRFLNFLQKNLRADQQPRYFLAATRADVNVAVEESEDHTVDQTG